MNIVVIAKRASDRDAICREINRSGEASSIQLEKIEDLLAALTLRPVSGVIIDVATSVRFSAAEKQTADNLLAPFPCLKARIVENQATGIGHQSISEFISSCRAFSPRVARTSHRITRYLGVHLYDNDSLADGEKTSTIDISDDGCFVFSPNEWIVGQEIWVQFTNGTVKKGVVKHCNQWAGDDHKIPGVGIKFDLTEVCTEQ